MGYFQAAASVGRTDKLGANFCAQIPAKASTSGKTEVIIIPESKKCAGPGIFTAVKAQVGNAVEPARRLFDGSTALRVAPAQ